MTVIIAQIIGIIAMLFNILSFQCKKKNHLILVLGMGSLLFSVNFLLLGSPSGAGLNLINIFRAATFMNKKTHNNIFFAVCCILYIAVAVFTYESLWTMMLLLSQLVATYAIWYKDGGYVRKAQFFCISPIWLINNAFVTFTIGGIICEAFTIISVLISFVRFGKEGFEK